MNFKNYLTKELFEALKQLQTDTKPGWGIMTAQHMVEHLSLFFAFSNGKINAPALFPPEQQQRNYNYIITDRKPFVRNFNPTGATAPPALKCDSLAASVFLLQKSVERFFENYEKDTTQTFMHPALGVMNFEDWQNFHVIHAEYHLEQFGLLKKA